MDKHTDLFTSGYTIALRTVRLSAQLEFSQLVANNVKTVISSLHFVLFNDKGPYFASLACLAILCFGNPSDIIDGSNVRFIIFVKLLYYNVLDNKKYIN